jgi:transcriptional regulator with XRE-family HTH domain
MYTTETKNDVTIVYMMTNTMDTAIEWLREQIESSPLDKTEIAKRAGISRASIYNYLSGLRRPEPEIMVALAEVFGYSAEYILSMAGMMQTESSLSARARQAATLINGLSLDDQDEALAILQVIAKRRGGAQTYNDRETGDDT